MTGLRFIDNRDGNIFAKSIREHLRALRNTGQSPQELCIATGYFNAAGWLQVAAEAQRIGKVRLLIGAEPTASTETRARQPGEPREPERTKQQVHDRLGGQIRLLKRERDESFEFRADSLGRLARLVEFFRSERVEVRRYEDRFFHAKAWLLRGESRGVLAGSSNLTAAGMANNLELNLGHYEDPTLQEVENWYDAVWEEAAPFDLAELYEVLFQEFSPWLIYLRVLWELYGDEVEEEPEESGHLTLTRFQMHGNWRARRILDELGGVIIADGVGLGKTHLMHAVGNAILERNPEAKVVYIPSERFVGDMVKALQLNAINEFKRYYRSVDALLIDDIQLFAGKERSQEEFFHTFNALLEGQRQIVLTCDRYPKEVNGLEERLTSRFGWVRG